MYPARPSAGVAVATLIVSTLLQPGCRGKSPGTASPAPAGPAPVPAPAIELYEPEATLENAPAGGGLSLAVCHWKVKYRFTQGQPRPGTWYLCDVTLSPGGAGILEVDGKDMKAQGVLEDRTQVVGGLPKSVQFELSWGQSKGHYQKVSAPVTCTVRQ